MSSNIAIRVEQLSKAYTIWSSPAARLHGPMLGRLGQLPFVPRRARQLCQRLSHESFRNFYALKDVSLEVRRGASVGVIGRNGSGKSTLLQILAGTLTPTEGEVNVNGSVGALLELGSGFNPEFTGRENVFMNAAIRGFSRKQTEAKFDTIARFADIGDFMDQPIKTYSSGMIVRLAFAISACVQPEVLIVDEALSVGDIFFQQKCARHMKERMQGVTKILVTHDLQAVCNLTEFVYVLDAGRMVFAGPPKAAVEYYVKLAQNEESGQPPGNGPSPAGPQRPIQFDRVPWIHVKADTQAGRGEVQIACVAVTDPAGVPVQTVQPHDRVVVHLILSSAVAKENIIVGYVINDRLGNAIFGDNTCGLPAGIFSLPAGRHLVRFEFEWPEICSGEYTLTPGVGEGTNPRNHAIQCWAHSIVKFSAINANRVGHCIFDNPLYNFSVGPI